MGIPFALRKGFQIDEDHPVVGSISGKAETRNGKYILRFRLLLQNRLDLMADAGRVFKRRTGGRLLGDYYVA